jgi:hypothetical protein
MKLTRLAVPHTPNSSSSKRDIRRARLPERDATMTNLTFNRRSLFGFLAGTVATAAVPHTAAAAVVRARSPELMVIYVGADDCGPCRTFEAEDMPRWEASPLSNSVRFVHAKARKSSQAFNARNWPQEARPFAGAFQSPIVPSFMLVQNGNVVSVGAGIRSWRQQTLPKLEQMART